jgi:hypothetical protein
MSDLMEKLMKSKAIMDRADGIKNSNAMNGGLPPTSLQQFDVPNAKYNIPAEFLQEQPSQQAQPYLSQLPRENTKPVGVPSVDAIRNSKLPDEIKKLMMENPIAQPLQQNVTISDDLIERASRLMKEQGGYVPESAKLKTTQSQPSSNTSQVDYKLIKKMISEAINEALTENGLMVESTEKSNEGFTFRVGKHIFEGKVTKIKKVS